MAEIHGTLDERFREVGVALSEQIDAREELGASIAVVLDGECVVDVWGGFADAERTRPWERDTITNVWSTTKTMTALAALVLVERGELDVHAKVSKYWPEFAANGKEDVLVRHLLSHTEVRMGFEPTYVGFANRCLTTWLPHQLAGLPTILASSQA
jgi:CubicO group peptidase (beta-lactamase class C family)